MQRFSLVLAGLDLIENDLEVCCPGGGAVLTQKVHLSSCAR